MYIYHSFIHFIGMCRMRRFLAVLRSFFHSSLLRNFSCHPSPPTILPSSLTSSCHLFLGLPLNLVVPKFIFLFSSILCTCPNQHNLINFIVSLIVGFFNTCINSHTHTHIHRPASWSSGQSLCLLIMRSRVRFPVLPWEFSLKGRIRAVTMVWVG